MPRSWGLNHTLYARAQIEHGLKEAGIGFCGFSPAARPQGGYQVYGVKALGSFRQGYYCHEIDPADGPPFGVSFEPSDARRCRPIRIVPRPAVRPARGPRQSPRLTDAFPMIYGPLGFQDSVDVSAGKVSPFVLTVDQGMIMAAIANELAGDAMRHAFSDGRIEQSVRPVIAIEEFVAGPPTQSLAVGTTDDRLPVRELNSKLFRGASR